MTATRKSYLTPYAFPYGALAYQFKKFRAAGHTLRYSLESARFELERKPVQQLRNADGRFDAYTSIGSYPIVYFTKRGADLCAKCASDDEQNEDDPVVAGDVYYEGAPLSCDQCGEETESAYGDPDAEDEPEDLATESA